MSNFREVFGAPGGLEMFGFSSCKPIILHPVFTVHPCSFADSGLSYDILDLADVADVFVADSTPRSIASDAS